MKLISALFLLFVTISLASSYPKNVVNVFQRNFDILHKEPPPPPQKSRAKVETEWMTQKLDHFNENDNRTWQMRYMSNSEFFENGGPLFIFVGGEWEISQGYITGGHMYDMAKANHGYLFYTEHRYYGKSRPTDDLSTKNLKYLHVRQALKDLAVFIEEKKANITGLANSKVILVGGSYSATMVTWFKELYPEIATGSWASSAPLFAKADFLEYKEVTGYSINLVGGRACYNRIQSAIAEMEYLFENKRGAEVKAMFTLCNNFDETNDLDLWTFFSEISDLFAGVVQNHVNGAIQGACSTILQGDDDVAGLAKFVLSMYGGANCLDMTYKSTIETLTNVEFGPYSIMRQWIYQTCNEYGWYQTSASKNQPFGTKFPLALYTSMCHDTYDKQFSNSIINNQVKETNQIFGGFQPNVDNVYFTHGDLDPWKAMGVRTTYNATVIPFYAHCKDLASISATDTAAMRASKEKIAQLVKEWINTE